MPTCRSCQHCEHVKYVDAPHIGVCNFLSESYRHRNKISEDYSCIVRVDMDHAHKICYAYWRKNSDTIPFNLNYLNR